MSIVVADTSPINYLLETGYIAVLRDLYARVVLPGAVHRELLDMGSSDTVRTWAMALPAWISVQEPVALFRGATKGLHRGEIDAIALAEELNAELLLMDDADGVKFALQRGLTITGTQGVLVEAAQNGRVEIDSALERLRNTDFRATPGLYEKARQLAFAKPAIPPRR